MQKSLATTGVLFFLLVSSCSIGVNQEITKEGLIEGSDHLDSATQNSTNPAVTLRPTLMPTHLSTNDVFLTEVSSNLATNIASSPQPTITPSGPIPECGRNLNPNFSPSGNWVAGICPFATYITDLDKRFKWNLSFDDLFGERLGLADGIVEPRRWSPDEMYLYLSIDIGAHGGIYFTNSWGMIGLNLQTGEIEEILEPVNRSGYSTQFSPDGQYLAYSQIDDAALAFGMLDLNSREVSIIELDHSFNQAGNFRWSNDQKKLALCMGEIDDELELVGTSLAIYDIKSKMLDVVLDRSDGYLCPISWISSDILKISDRKNDYSFNLETGTISE